MAESIIPEGFVPYNESIVPEGFQFIDEAKKSGAISSSKAKDLPNIGRYKELNKFFLEIPGMTTKGTLSEIGKSFATSFLVSISDDEETGQILKNRYPGSKILKDDEGGTVFVSPEGEEFAIDAPGLDSQDITRAIVETVGFSLKAGTNILSAALHAGGKQTAIEASQESVGGEFEPGNIIFASVGAGAGQFLGEILGRGVTSLKEGAERIIKEGDSLGSPILTSDIVDTEAASAIIRFITRVTDKYPIVGTATQRAEQRGIRNQLGGDLAREFHITDDLAFHPRAVTEAIESIHIENIAKASRIRSDAVNSLVNFGRVPITLTQQKIISQVDELKRLGMKSDKSVIRVLEDIAVTLPKAQNFSNLAFMRTRIIRAIKEAERGSNPAFPYEAASRLKSVKSTLDKEMQNFADGASMQAGRKWKESNKLFADEFSAYDKTILAKIASEGSMAVDKLTKTIASTDTKSLKQLYNQLDAPGRLNSKAAIIQNALEKSGYFIDDFKPFKLASELNKPAIKVFFKGQARKELDGLSLFIRSTKQSTIARDITPTGFGLAEIASMPVSLIGRIYQSKPMRNMLVKLSKSNPNSNEARTLIDDIRDHIWSFRDEITSISAISVPETVKETLQ